MKYHSLPSDVQAGDEGSDGPLAWNSGPGEKRWSKLSILQTRRARIGVVGALVVVGLFILGFTSVRLSCLLMLLNRTLKWISRNHTPWS